MWRTPSASPLAQLPDSLDWDLDALVGAVDGAQHEIVGQMLTYSVQSGARRDTTLDAALRRAAARGVRVRIIASDWEAGGRGMQDLQSLARVPGIEAKLSSVPEWSGGYVPFARVEHCKLLVADTLRAWIGTSNWSPDYFFSSRNVAVTITNRGIARRVRDSFERSWTAPGARVVHPDSTYAPRVHGEDAPPGMKKYGG